MEEKEKRAPVKKFIAGAITATIWQNSTQKQGERVEYNTISFGRNYKDKDGKWQTTNSLRLSDLPKAVVVLNNAYTHLVLKPES